MNEKEQLNEPEWPTQLQIDRKRIEQLEKQISRLQTSLVKANTANMKHSGKDTKIAKLEGLIDILAEAIGGWHGSATGALPDKYLPFVEESNIRILKKQGFIQ